MPPFGFAGRGNFNPLDAVLYLFKEFVTSARSPDTSESSWEPL
jgi:hypothetical protein